MILLKNGNKIPKALDNYKNEHHLKNSYALKLN
jgi:hypothetical protein